mgnify:FL=1
MKYQFKYECEDCTDGITSDRHPNDPSAKDVYCWNCEGNGWLPISDTNCTSVQDVLANYPKAFDIREIS